MQNYVDYLSDSELEMLVGGDGGYVKTITKDCPDVFEYIDINLGGVIQTRKSCT